MKHKKFIPSNKKVFSYLLFLLISTVAAPHFSWSQTKDSLLVVDADIVDSSKFSKKTLEKISLHNPRTATIRSAILPGLGQIYNKKYWKLPIVYAALGITGYIFVDNIKTYREYRKAFTIRYNSSLGDSTGYNELKDLYKVVQMESIRSARDQFRKYIDYSAIFFLVFWGLNVVDATVDAHLKAFDVSPDLSLKLKAGHSEMAGTNGLSILLKIGAKKPAPLLAARF